MAIRTRRSFSFVFAMMMSIMVLSGCCSARVYKVGDSEGWTAKDDVYYSWAETDYKEFHVGDSLVFEYDHIINDPFTTQLFEYANEVNDVYEISGDLEFITCDPTSSVAVHDLVSLTEPVVHYFITSQSGYCEAELKLRVMVGPVPKAVTYHNFPKKVDLSAMEPLNNWLKTFTHQPHH
ncbi:hypothetical protein Bca4012_070977 [Brassica carinata]